MSKREQSEDAQDQATDVLDKDENPQAPAVADDVLPDTLYLMPVPHRPFFPGQAQPVAINPREWGTTLKAVGEAGHGLIGLAYVDQSDPADVQPRQFPEIGCVVRLHGSPVAPDQAGHFLAQGVKRFRIVRWLSDKPPYLVQVEYPRSQGDRGSDEIKAYAMALIKEIKELLPLNPLYSEELKQYLANFSPTQPSLLADFSAALTTASGEQLQEILDTLPLLSANKASLASSWSNRPNSAPCSSNSNWTAFLGSFTWCWLLPQSATHLAKRSSSGYLRPRTVFCGARHSICKPVLLTAL